MALGSVATATFTRAEIDNMLKKAMYSEGKVVWSGTLDAQYDSSLNVPSTVDYVNVSGHPMVRGGRILYQTSSTDSGGNAILIESTITFSNTGTLTASRYIMQTSTLHGIRDYPVINCTGYHYY